MSTDHADGPDVDGVRDVDPVGISCLRAVASPGGKAPKVRPWSSQASAHMIPPPRDGDNTDPGPFISPRTARHAWRLHLAAGPDAQDTSPFEYGIEDVILAHEGSRVGKRSPGPHELWPSSGR